jgi:hypothetical protein
MPTLDEASTLNEAKGLPDNGRHNETPHNLVDDVKEIDELDIFSGQVM